MKLNYRNTFLVGLAFMSIISFWQLYDNIVPLLLTNTFHMNETASGVIMAADNVLALFLLPFFGKISDRTSTKIGKRMPYIVVGTLVAAVLLILLPVIDNGAASSKEGFFFSLPMFVIVLGLMLFTMAVYRTPAVALMPDITPKPLRSRGNAIINLMGALGGIIYLAFAAIMYPKSKTEGLEHVDYMSLFVFMAIFMLVCVGVMFALVRENKLVAVNKKIEDEHPEWNIVEESAESTNTGKLPKDVRRSMMFLLASIALWYIGYNAVTTWFTTYISKIMGEGIGGASLCFLIANVGAIVSYIPLGMLAAKIGRKKSIYFGTGLLTVSFALAGLLTVTNDHISVLMYLVFALVGVAWAAISVNSLPMVVEMCSGADLGKFTGFYYTASMAGQVVTPILAGTLMRLISYKVLFVYATTFSFLSICTMVMVKHGDSKAQAPKGLESFEDFD
ncbi:MAG: MFS transporter [Saccharofermentans sp.]|nr:MFS transporter [Saccharofermentans sp.]